MAEALQKFEEALAAMDWSEGRKLRLGKILPKNGTRRKLSKFWNGNAEQ